ncbi:putative cytokinin oxidase [Minicystis rosea]|nr:putative cytokinin oxidase [Minicystis rosea]
MLPRRSFLGGSLAVAVAAWSPEAKSWTQGTAPGSISIPSLDGQLLTDAASLAQAGDDFGHIIHRAPAAVLVPGSVDDIVKIVRFARKHGIKVAGARGLGESHSTFGQSQVAGGVVIDMRALATIHEINACDALVDAGVRWSELLQQTVPLGKSPPTLTDYIELSVGGTLSVGGIGGQVFRHGLQVDNVLELEVVTGEGKLITCSPFQHPLLFSAVRAGLGQFGIIVKARVRLVDVAPLVRTYTALYDDLAAFTSDQLALIDDGRFDYVEGSVVPAAGGGWAYSIECAKYFEASAPPDDDALLDGLSFLPGTEAADDKSYFDFANRIAPTVAFLQQVGAWDVPHPWMDLFVPASQVVPFVQSVLDQTTLADTGQGPILLYPFHRNRLTAPFMRVPNEPEAFLFDLLRFAIPPDPDFVSSLIAKNRAFFDACTAIGGKRYPISSVPVTQADWKEHFSPLWGLFKAAKAAFDPDHVLTPGQGIF